MDIRMTLSQPNKGLLTTDTLHTLFKVNPIQNQGSQTRQIWRILRQNWLDDSTEVTEGVTSTPEIFGNKNSFVLTFFATNTIYVNCKRCIKTLIKSSKLKNYTARQSRKRVNYDQSLLDDRHHGFELSRSADRYTCQDHVLESLKMAFFVVILDSKYSKTTPKFVKQKSQ